jgi:hypothetical protein
MLRIKNATPLSGYRLRLTLTDGSVVERDVETLLQGPVFEPIRRDPELFRKVTVERGTLCGPGDVDLCPDTSVGRSAADRRARFSRSRPRSTRFTVNGVS